MRKQMYIEFAVLMAVISTFCFPIKMNGTILNFEGQLTVPVTLDSLAIDGHLNEKAWHISPIITFKPIKNGIPEDLGGNVRMVRKGNYLCIGSFCPEPGGKVLAKSIGFNPDWAKDLPDGPDLEDRIILKLSHNISGGEKSGFKLEINPWGAIRIEQNGELVPETKILGATNINTSGWSAEIGIPLEELNLINKKIDIELLRIRSMRPLAPEFQWEISASGEDQVLLFSKNNKEVPAPLFNPTFKGNSTPPLEVGFVQKVPPINGTWQDAFWSEIPEIKLLRNEPLPRSPKYPTQIKWVHDGKTFAVFFRCTEDERLDCDSGARDSNVGSDDHVCIYLATSGASVIEILTNPAGAVRDSKASGSHMSLNPGAWNGNIKKHCLKVSDAWYVRLDIPLIELAAALDETSIPAEWKILTGRIRKSRIGWAEEVSTIPVLENSYLLAPARYRRLNFTNKHPNEIRFYKKGSDIKLIGLAGELAQTNSSVFSREEKKFYNIPAMLSNNIRDRIRELAREEKEEWNQVHSLEDWKKYREKRVSVIKDALGEFPQTRSPLKYEVTETFRGEGYQVKNILYQSRPGIFVPANLYLPEKLTNNMPGMIILPGHHYPRTEGELQDCGMIWARSGCAVLVLERVGMGERVVALPWHRRPYQSEYLINSQLDLVGQSRYGWMTWDVIRAVDLFHELGNIDTDRIILFGAVTWGGSPPAAVAGLIENRIDAVIPFGFGRYHWESWGIRNLLAHKITPWFVYNSVAPRKFVYAHEFWWEGEEGPAYPSVWTPPWPRYKKVFKLYNAEENLETAQGTGLLRIKETAGDCYNIGPVQRKAVFPILNKWFKIPFPSEEDQNIEIDSKLSFAKSRSDYTLIKYKESERRIPHSKLKTITPEVSAKLNRKALHQVAREIGEKYLISARKERSALNENSAKKKFKSELKKILKDIEPTADPIVKLKYTKTISNASLEAFTIFSEPGIIIPFLIIKPNVRNSQPFPLVIAISEGGKDRFLKSRGSEIERLVNNGIAVCIPDVRGIGETAPDQYNRNSSFAYKEIELGKTLLGLRVKDIRTVLAYIKKKQIDVNPEQIALWGETFAPPNKGEIWVDELAQQPVSPQIQHYASPLGAQLALLTSLYEQNIRATAVRGGLIGYLSILEDNFAYIPTDMIVPNILKVGDVKDICASLAPMPLFGEKFVDGKNYIVDDKKLQEEMKTVKKAYQKTGVFSNLVLPEDSTKAELVSWLIKQLKG